MKLDLNGVNLLAELEGLELQVYKCSAGDLTIDWGNTFMNGSKVKRRGYGCQARTSLLFILSNLLNFEKTINENVKVK
jgi:GH24 family phage-related lysozyme (muramidase)